MIVQQAKRATTNLILPLSIISGLNALLKANAHQTKMD